jgi:hypothetical protein
MNDNAIGYRKIERNAPSARMCWSMRMANPSPSAMATPT